MQQKIKSEHFISENFVQIKLKFAEQNYLQVGLYERNMRALVNYTKTVVNNNNNTNFGKQDFWIL